MSTKGGYSGGRGGGGGGGESPSLGIEARAIAGGTSAANAEAFVTQHMNLVKTIGPVKNEFGEVVKGAVRFSIAGVEGTISVIRHVKQTSQGKGSFYNVSLTFGNSHGTMGNPYSRRLGFTDAFTASQARQMLSRFQR